MAHLLQITDKAPEGGGIRQVVETQQELLQARDWTCRRLYLGSHSSPDDFCAPTRVMRRLAANDPALLALQRAAQGVDVIHLHLGFSSLSPDFVSAAARLAPLVVSLHDISPFDDPPKPPPPLRDRLRRRYLRPVRRALWGRICDCASVVIAPGQYLADRAISAGLAPAKLEILPHPLQVRTTAPPPPSQQAPVILYAGLLCHEKGAPLLLEAFALLNTPDASLVFVGAGPQYDALIARAARLGLADRVTFTGQVSAAMVAQKMADMRVLAHPSLIAEGFGLVGIEAMQQGRPVVGFGSGGAADWLIDGQTGLLAAPKTAEALAIALDRVLGDDALADRLGAKARKFVEANFARERIGDQLATLLGVAAQRGAHGLANRAGGAQ